MTTRAKIVALCLGLCVGLAAHAQAQVRSVVYVSGLNAPLEFVQDPTQPNVQMVVQQGGSIRVVQNGSLMTQPFLDLSGSISTGGERGLLGMAFAPDYATSRRFFVNFTNPSGHTVVARFTRMASDPLRADASSRFDFRWGSSTGPASISQPYSNHNGGHLAFGADGYLYIGMGDGGSGGDPENRAQNPDTLLGKMLRIDVNVADGHAQGYVVPADNPFVSNSGVLPEIWSFGLRNPWKFSFDAAGSGGSGTGAMVLGDVGQGAHEEINYEPAGVGGRNYGWRLREGLSPYLPNTPPAFLPVTDPILDYPRSEGQSVTGGFVYRGTALVSGFRGRYFFADFVSGRVWSVGLTLGGASGATVTDRVEHTAELGGSAVLGNIAAFGTDSEGELYLTSFNGTVIRIAHNPSASGPIGGTTSTTPSAPAITGVTAGNGQLTIAFTAGPDGGAVLTNYEYSTNGGNTFAARAPASTSSPLVIGGLTNGTTYAIRLRAVNARGAGAAASAAGTPGSGQTLPPFGQVDTPAQSAAGVVGAIGITGWALDDVGVSHVRIYRNCLAGVDNPASCQALLGESVVFVGQAAFLPDARPDVEAAFPTYPNAGSAGWGMQILTLMLPHVPNSQTTGGQGPITLYAIATDLDGHLKLLGRSFTEGSAGFATPTSITMANDTIAKPFGTIDTPALAGTVSGTIANFGWVLTPDANTTVDGPADILMPVNGSTLVVYIDGVATALVAYNQCRGTVGNPVPAGVFCNDDVANTFGNTTPQATLTARTSNPTRFRNLDAARGAIGAYVINTTSLSNGRHTLAWGVEDSAGRAEGIGSRFFSVSNGAVVPAGDEPALARAPAAVIADAPMAGGGVWGRTSYSRSAPWQQMRSDSQAVRHVRLPEMGRVEIWFQDAPASGHLVANGTLRDLPVGSVLEGQRFTWAPGPGHLGTYRLVFLQGGTRTDVDITIAPPRARAAGEPEVRMGLDSVAHAGSLRVEGWAFDPEAPIGSGVGAVHVWAQTPQGPVFLGVASLNAPRPDVGTAFGPAFSHAGFTLNSTVVLPPGTHAVTAYVWLERTARWEDARSATVVR